MPLASRLTLLVVLLVAPWLYAGVFESTQVWLAGGVLIALILALPSLLTPHPSLLIPHASLFAPLLVAVLWCALQLVPLPKTIVALLSPNAVKLRAEMMQEERARDTAAQGETSDVAIEDKYPTISLRPSATRVDFTWLIVSTIVFLLAAVLFSDAVAAMWLFAAIGLNGALLALFGLLQMLTWNGQIYWSGIVPDGTAFASFGNRNNCAGYLNLCLAAGLGFTIWIVARGRDGRPSWTSRNTNRRRGSTSWRRQQVVAFLADLDVPKLAAYLLSIAVVCAVFSTLSRGGGISLFGAGAAATLAAAYAQHRAGPTVWLIAALATGIGLVAWVGMFDALEARFQTLGETERLLSKGRWPNWLDALHAVPDYPLTGSGLGTYRDIYLPYQHRFSPGWHEFAENQYVQAVVEAGPLGLLLMVVMLVVVTLACLRLVRPQPESHQHPKDRDQHLVRAALGYAGLFAVVSQAIHGAFDFGLYAPANMLLMAALCGMVVGAVTRRNSKNPPPIAARGGRDLLSAIVERRFAAPVALLLLAGGTWGWLDLNQVARVTQALNETHFQQTPQGATDRQLDRTIERLRQLTPVRPDDAELWYELAKARLQQFRLRRLMRLRQEAPAEVDLEELWDRASVVGYHKLLYAAARAEDPKRIAELRTDPLIDECLKPALKDLVRARAAGPILAKVHLRLAPVVVAIQPLGSDAVHLRRASRLEPSGTYTRTRAGRLHAQAGRLGEACRDWQAILSLAHGQLEVVLPWALEMLSDRQIAEEMLPGDPEWLVELSVTRFRAPQDASLRRLLWRRAAALLEQAPVPDDVRAYLTARILDLQGQMTEAVEHYVHALELRPGEAAWHYEFAVLLQKLDRIEDAHRHAVSSTRWDPGNRRYDALLRELIRQRIRR